MIQILHYLKFKGIFIKKKQNKTLKHSRMQDVEVEIHFKKIQWAVISNSFQHVSGIGTHVIL